MHNNYILSLAAGFIITVAASAGTMGGTLVQDWHWFSSVSAGPAWTNPEQIQSIYLTPEIEKTYVTNESTQTIGSGDLFVGVQQQLSYGLLGQFGLAAAISGNAHIQGIIWDDEDPQFDNLVYRYKVFHSHIAVKGKLFKDLGYWFTPWISGSLGVGFNNSYDFSNTALIYEALPNENYTNYTQNTFTYTVGAGIQRILNDHWSFGAGYEFADWGKSELGKSSEQIFNTKLKLNHLYSNAVLFNITYLS